MLLLDYLRARGLNFSKAARSLAERFPQTKCSPQQMRSWCLPRTHREADYPRPYRYRQLWIWSGGAVAPNDFYDLPALTDSPATDAGDGEGAAEPRALGAQGFRPGEAA